MSVSKIVYQSDNNVFQLQVLGIQTNPRIHVENWDIVCTWTPTDFKTFYESIESAQDAQAQQQILIENDPTRCYLCGKVNDGTGSINGSITLSDGTIRFFCKYCGMTRQAKNIIRAHQQEAEFNNLLPRIASLNGKPYDDRGDYKFPNH
jgi:hypothetical protein